MSISGLKTDAAAHLEVPRRRFGFTGKALLLILLLAGTIYQLRYFYLTTEDAWIGLKYVRNFANGYGFVSNELGAHEEGFSNLTMVLITAAVGRLGFDFLLVSKAVGIFSVFGSSLALIWALRERNTTASRIRVSTFAIIALAVFPFAQATVFWSTSGLETTLYGFFVTLQFALLASYFHTEKIRPLIILPFACVLAVMTRPEALLYLGYIPVVTFLLSRYSIGLNFRSSLLRASGVVLGSSLLVAIHLGWRLYYFGEPVSNPAYVKLAVSLFNPISARFAYVLGYFTDESWLHATTFALGVLAIVAGALFRRRDVIDRRHWTLAAVALGFVGIEAIFVLYAGADYLLHSRFMSPVTAQAAVVMSFGAVTLLRLVSMKRERLSLAACVLVAIAFTGCSVLQHSESPSWPDVGYRMTRATDNFYDDVRDWNSINEIKASLAQSSSNVYAHSEFGFIPYHLPGVQGIDMAGLNDHVIAKTFASYPIFEANRAVRDYVLGNLPGVISTYGYWREKDGVHFLPSVGWFFGPYLSSQFFLENYDVRFADSGSDLRLLTNTLKSKFEGVAELSASVLAHGSTNRDKLMDGFYIEENSQIWVSRHARVLLTRSGNQNFLRIRGFLPEISNYPSRTFEIHSATTDRYVGDRTFGKFTIQRSGSFEIIAALPDDARTKKHVMVDLFATQLNPRAGDARELSWLLNSISLQ